MELRKKRCLGKGGESKKTQKRLREGKREARAENTFHKTKYEEFGIEDEVKIKR